MKSHWPVSILSVISSIFGMLLPLILVRELAPDAIGQFKIFFLYLMIFPALTMIAGVSSGLSYWAGRGDEGRKAIRTSSLLFLGISFVFLVLLHGLRAPIASSIGVSRQMISLFSFAVFFGISSFFYEETAIATGRIWTGAIFNSGFEILRAACIVWVAVVTRDLVAIIKAHIVVQMLKMLCGYFLAYRQNLFRLEWDFNSFKAVRQYAFPVSLGFVFGLWLNYSDQIILSRLIPAAAFAVYTVCCLTVQPLMVLEASVTRVLIPQLSSAFSQGQSERAAAMFSKSVRDLASFVFPAVTGMVIFASPIIRILFTSRYLGGLHYLQFYAFWYLALVIPPDALARARGEARWIFWNFAVFSVLTLLLCGSAAFYFGPMGALLGLLAARMASRFYTIQYMRRTAFKNISDFIPLRPLAQMALACASLGLGCLALRPLFHSSLTWFLVAGPGFTLAYFAFLFFQISPMSKNKIVSERRVLMLTPGLAIGGLERMILNLSGSLQKSLKWEPRVMAYDFGPSTGGTGGKEDLVSSFLAMGIPVESSVKPPRFSLKTALQVARSAWRNEVSVIHTHDLGALIYGSFAKLFLRFIPRGGVRLIHTQHSFIHLGRAKRYSFYEKFFARFADEIAVVSEDTRQSYLKLGVPGSKLHLIPNGVAFPELPQCSRDERISARLELIAESESADRLLPRIDDLWVLYMARIHGRKGQDHALEIWGKIHPEQRKKMALIFLGPETQKGELARLQGLIERSPERNRVIYAGSAKNPEKWLRAADIFLSCSEFEGMPLSPIEALGAGVPAVLSRIPGHEFLDSVARLYPLDRPEAAAASMEEMAYKAVNDPAGYREEIWEKSESIRNLFTLRAMSSRYESLYENERSG